MSDRPKRVKSPAPDGWEQLATAVRETGAAIVEAMREAFGPQVRLVTDGAQSFLDSVEVDQGPEAAGQLLASALIEQEEEHLKREIRVGDRLPPGTPVAVFGQHAGVVVDEPDRVLVQLAGYTHPVSFPRSAIAKEGETWTPPKHTSS